MQEILLTLIEKGHVSIMDFPYLSSFRTRISDLNLKHSLALEKKNETRCNKYGNPYTFVIHFLEDSQRDRAIEIYKEMQK